MKKKLKKNGYNVEMDVFHVIFWMVLIQIELRIIKNSRFLKKNLRKNDGYVIKNGKICYKKFHFFSIFTMSCTKFFKEKIRKMKRIEGEPYTSWYKFLNYF